MTECFVYFFYDSNNTLLYIGKTINLKNRFKQHFLTESLTNDIWKQTIDKNNITLFKCNNPTDLDVYETYFINKYNPLYNIDKVFYHLLSFELPHLDPIIYQYKPERIRGICFRDDIKRYLYLIKLNNPSDLEIEELNGIREDHPLIEVLVDRLGSKRIVTLGYNKTKILQEYDDNSPDKIEVIKNFVLSYFLINVFYSLAETKILLQELYFKLNISRIAKASDIKQFINVKRTKRLDNDIMINGFIRY